MIKNKVKHTKWSSCLVRRNMPRIIYLRFRYKDRGIIAKIESYICNSFSNKYT